MYVDESGDPGIKEHSSPHYILSGIIVHQKHWLTYLSRVKLFRKHLSQKYGLNQRTEIHAKELIRISSLKEYSHIRKSDRINILRECADQLPLIFKEAHVINVCLNKISFANETDFQALGWQRLMLCYEGFLKTDGRDNGIIIADDTDGKVVLDTIRKMRLNTPTGTDIQLHSNGYHIIEDVFQRASHHSYFLQSADVISHLLYRKEFPKGSLKKYGMEFLFDRFSPILYRDSSSADILGIVRK